MGATSSKEIIWTRGATEALQPYRSNLR
ncbi:hypothetical protein OH492_24670 [Vibrio chagasii]|nr:hypothetical protein [Vibrio chagasii]